jgi:hypothetical protein
MPDEASHFEPPDPIDRPICSNCGWTMWVAAIALDRPGHHKHTFKCDGCQSEHIRIVRIA